MKKYYTLVVVLAIISTVSSQVTHNFTFQSTDFNINTDSEKYTHIEGQGFDGFTAQEGAPELPVVVRNSYSPWAVQ